MQNKQIQGKLISAIPGRTGTSTGKDGRQFTWQMFAVIINDIPFTTFDPEYQNKVGVEGVWSYKEEVITSKNGKQYTRRTLDRLLKENPLQFVMKELEKINKKLNEILEIQQINSPIKNEDEDFVPDDEPNPDQIPF